MLASLTFGLALSTLAQVQTPQNTAPNIPLDVNGPYDRMVLNPETILGYKIGDRITTYRDQERVYESIATRSGGKVKRIDYGMSNNRFPLRVYAISSAKNIARLDVIQASLEKAAQKGEVPAADIPTIVWVNETIHGNEPASFEAGMSLIYNLVAGRGQFSKALDNVVVILNPVYNPDGHEQFAVGYNAFARGNYQPGSFENLIIGQVGGRQNYYRFDMNRDRVSFTQIETQQEVALMQKWRPQIYLDQHGEVDNYFFPPNPMSINENVDRNRLNKWTDILGKACAKAFDDVGWSYFIRESFDLYYPGYLDTHTTLSGAIGITHETDGGKALAKTRDDGSIVTLREGAAKHMTTALAVIKIAGEQKTDLLKDWASYKKRAVTGTHAGNFKRVVVSSKSIDDLIALQTQLNRTGVKSTFNAKPFKQAAHDYWSDKVGETEFPAESLVIDMNQEYGPIAKTLLEIKSDFEAEFIKKQTDLKGQSPEGERYPRPEGTEFYDLTGWALPYAHNLKAWWCEDTVPFEMVTASARTKVKIDPKVPGYVIPYDSQNSILAVHDLLAKDVKVSVTSSDLKVGGKTFPKGSFFIFRIRNGENLPTLLAEVADARGATVHSVETSYPDGDGREGPGNRLLALTKPNFGMIFGSGANNPGISGSWFEMEQVFKLPFISLSTNLSAKTLSKYTAIIAPSGSGVSNNSSVKDWVREGGVLVVLDDTTVAIGGFFSLTSTGVENRSLPGSIFRAKLDKRSLLASGYEGDEIAVPVEGNTFYKFKKEGGAVVKFGSDDKVKKLLTGWSWGEETEKALRDSVWMHDEPLGQGHVIWFAYNPAERAMWPGLNKLFLNSLILAPSL